MKRGRKEEQQKMKQNKKLIKIQGKKGTKSGKLVKLRKRN
jgi:hypothetical protein